MYPITESKVVLRAEAELPMGFNLRTEEFRAGWNLMRSGGVRRLEKKIHTQGWNLTKTADGKPRSGVGKTSQEAVGSALRQALGQVGPDSNAVEVGRIKVTEYPWFFVARVFLHAYRIQEGAALAGPHEAPAAALPLRQKRASHTLPGCQHIPAAPCLG